MTEPASTDDPLLIDCPACEGVGRQIRPCSCRLHGNQKVIGADDPLGYSDPFEDCTRCGGTGSTVTACSGCETNGKARAQMVATVVNLDTATIASATIIPGVIDPVPKLVGGRESGLYEMPLQPVVDALTTAVGGTALQTRQAGPGNEARLKPIPLYAHWQPDQTPDQQWRAVARALASQRPRRHSFFFTTGRDQPTAAPDDQLLHLCRLAEALRVDLRIFHIPFNGTKANDRRWQIDLALAGQPNPIPPPNSGPQCTTLAAALTIATDNLTDLVARLCFPHDGAATAPARQIEPLTGPPTGQPGSAETLAGRLRGLADPGGLGIWRDGTWHCTTLEMEQANRRFYESANGQIRETVDWLWRLVQPPPKPEYFGDPIPERGCPDCETGTVWKPCECRDGLDDEAFAGCDICGGTGWKTGGACGLCGNIGSIRYGATITLSDLDAFTTHVGIVFDADTRRLPQRQFDIREDERQQLPEESRLTRILFELGIDLADVTTFDGRPPAADLLDGAAMARADGPRDALAYNYTATASRGHPGARIFLRLNARAPGQLERLAQIAGGLGYDVAIAAEDRSHDALSGTVLGGTRWGVKLLEPGAPLERGTVPLPRRDLSAAVADSVDHLPHLLNIARKTAPSAPLAAPQQAAPPDVPIDGLEAALSKLATQYGGAPISTITARIEPTGRCVIVRHPSMPEARYMPPVVLGTGDDVPAAIAAVANRPASD